MIWQEYLNIKEIKIKELNKNPLIGFYNNNEINDFFKNCNYIYIKSNKSRNLKNTSKCLNKNILLQFISISSEYHSPFWFIIYFINYSDTEIYSLLIIRLKHFLWLIYKFHKISI